MAIKASDVKELRDMTGAGMMDCKRALEDTNGDIQEAVNLLREQGQKLQETKAHRIASEGLIESYLHNGKIGVLVEVNSETDFAAKNEAFKEFAKDIAMQVAAMNPKYVSRDEVPEEEVEAEKEVLIKQALNESKPGMDEAKARMIAEKKVEGRLDKFFEEICLLDQKFIKDQSMTIDTLLKNLIAKIGENIKVRRFVRYEVGEGLEKKEEDFAEEVAKQMGK